jgi:hypothetical protein
LCSTGWWSARLGTRPRPQGHIARKEVS